jgi:competence protein ComFC
MAFFILLYQNMLKTLIDFLFPKKCLICKRDIEEYELCKKCLQNIPVSGWIKCIRCGKRLPNAIPCPIHKYKTPITGILSATDFNRQDIRYIIHQYKYKRKQNIYYALGEILKNSLNISGFSKILIEREAVLVPIPLSPKRLKQRKFNQSELIAKYISSEFNLKLYNDVLLRPIERPPQVKIKEAAKRRENIKGVFKVNKIPEDILKCPVVLVDDVSTSGATLEEAGGVLKEAGIKTIWAIVVASKK